MEPPLEGSLAWVYMSALHRRFSHVARLGSCTVLEYSQRRDARLNVAEVAVVSNYVRAARSQYGTNPLQGQRCRYNLDEARSCKNLQLQLK